MNMHNTVRISLFLTAVIAAAATHVTLDTAVGSLPTTSGIEPVKRMVQEIRSGPYRSSRDEWERRIAEGARTSADTCLQLKMIDPPSVRIFTFAGSDILIANWKAPRASTAVAPHASAVVEEAWVWDAPKENVILLRVPLSAISKDRIADTLEELIRWESLKLQNLRIQTNGIDFLGTGPHESGNSGDYHVVVSAVLINGEGYIAISVSKLFFFMDYPPGSWGVTERFPPLADRIQNTPTRELIERLSESSPSRDTNEWVKILIRVLVQRDLSPGDLKKIAFDDSTSFYVVNSRFSALVANLHENRRLPLYEDILSDLLSDVARLDNPRYHDLLFAYVIPKFRLSLLTKIALFYVSDVRYSRVCISNLGRYGDSRAVYETLSKAAVPNGLIHDKEVALSEIKARMEKPK